MTVVRSSVGNFEYDVSNLELVISELLQNSAV